MFNYDFLIIGSGIAGLSYSLKVANKLPKAKIAIVTKSDADESSTKYAQGGIAVVLDQLSDSFNNHIQDTLIAGDGLSDPEVVDFVIKEGPLRFKELVRWGVNFDKENNGHFDLGLEGVHSNNRILHHKDITGFEIEQTLLSLVDIHKNIDVFAGHMAIDLITQHKSKEPSNKEQSHCYGAYILDQNTNEVKSFLAKTTLLASGGLGQLYQNTTNPTISTGDGVAMAYRSKARIENMEFIQFHPTALFDPQSSPSFLISEAIRGAGAKLRNKSGDLFMHNYHPKAELASRDIVSRAIDLEIKRCGDDYVYLDCTTIGSELFKSHFPNILQKVRKFGIDPLHEFIPVVPAAHYSCGGVKVNKDGQSSIHNLFVCGECSCNGLHGANRLASNSLLEALVFSHRSFLKAIKTIDSIQIPNHIDPLELGQTTSSKKLVFIEKYQKELKSLMTDFVGLVRTDSRLFIAAERLELMHQKSEKIFKHSPLTQELIELKNMIIVAQLVVKQSIARKENKGVFFRRKEQLAPIEENNYLINHL